MRPSVTVEGDVVQQRINRGSKSDQEAVVLLSDTTAFKLRRQGAASFADGDIRALVGKRIRATGIVSAGQLIMSKYTIIDSA